MEAEHASSIYVHTCREAELPGDNFWLGPRELCVFEHQKSQTRRQSYRLGRWTAKHLLAHALHLPNSLDTMRRLEILGDKDGAPVAHLDQKPLCECLSLSHREKRALAALGPSGLSLGCDLEWIEPRSRAFVEDFFSPEESQATLNAPNPAFMANLIWSAKESALKAQRVGLSRDTRELLVQIDTSIPHFAQSWHPLGLLDPGHSKCYHGAFLLDGGFVLTLMADIPKAFLLPKIIPIPS